MRRWALRIFVLLLLGAIVNVAVAWGLAYSIPPHGVQADSGTLYQHENWTVSRFLQTGSLALCVNKQHHVREPERVPEWSVYFPEATNLLPPWSDVLTNVPEFERAEAWSEFRSIRANGWPALSLWGEAGSTLMMVDSERRFLRMRWAIDVGTPWHDQGFDYPRVLPIRPIWPGFAINTVFDAVVLWGGWLLFAGPFVLRHRRRIRRGLCPKCAYDLRGTPEATACPECGATTGLAPTSAIPK